jgi:2-phospho-L-lactate transferase/gluconeogenesis factor (CofD/UPF0052 family)
MEKFFAATLSRCQIVTAENLTEAIKEATQIFGDRLKVVRPATDDEVELHETWPNEVHERGTL